MGAVESVVNTVADGVTSVGTTIGNTVVSVGSTAVSNVTDVANTTISYAGSYTNTALSTISGPLLSTLTTVADTGGGIANDYGNGIIAYNSGLVIDWSTQQVGTGLNAYLYLTERALAIPSALKEFTPANIRSWATTLTNSTINISDAVYCILSKKATTFFSLTKLLA